MVHSHPYSTTHMSSTPSFNEKDPEALTSVHPVTGGSRAGDMLERDDGVPRSKGVYAHLWKAMSYFDRVS